MKKLNPELSAAEKDLQKKVTELLNTVNKKAKQNLKKYLKENSYAQETHLKEGMIWNVPKDFLIALLEEAIWDYSPTFSPTLIKRKSNKNIKTIKRNL